MHISRILAALGAFGGLVAAAQDQVPCETPSTFSCGNQHGAPGPDGAIYVCSSLKKWVRSAQCGCPTCCVQPDDIKVDVAHCSA